MSFSPSPAPTTPDTAERIQSLWQRNLPVLNARLDLLTAAALATQDGNPSQPFLAEAVGVAHKLAGSLGMFGYPEGTAIALRLQEAFSSPTPDGELLVQLTEQLRASLYLALG